MVVVLQYLHDTSAGEGNEFVLHYLLSTSADVATLVVVLEYWLNTSADVATVVVVLQYWHNT